MTSPPPTLFARERSVLVVFVWAIASLCALIAAGTLVTRGADHASLIAIGAAGLVVVFAPLAAGRRFLPFEPLVYVLFTILIGFTLKTVYVVYATTPKAENLIRFGRAPSFFLDGAFWTFVALVFLAAGYAWGRQRVPLERFRLFHVQVWPTHLFRLVVVSMVAISAAAVAAYVVLMDVSFSDLNAISSKRFYEVEGASAYGSLGYLVAASRLAEYAAYLTYAQMVAARKPFASAYGMFMSFAILVASVIPFVSNSRQSAVVIVFNIFVLSIILRRGVSVKNLVLILALVGSLITVLTLLRTDRSEEIGSALVSSFVVEEIIGSRHFSDFARTSHIIAAVPDKLEYKYGASFAGFAVALVPRSFWKGKPVIGTEKEVAQKVFGVRDRTGVPPGIVAEIVMNYGFYGIPIIMFLIGWFMKIFYLSFIRILLHPAGAVLYVSLVYTFTLTVLNNESAVVVARTLITAVPVVASLWVLGRAPSRRTAPRVARSHSWTPHLSP